MNGKQIFCVLVIIIVVVLLASLPACAASPEVLTNNHVSQRQLTNGYNALVVTVDSVNRNICYSLFQKAISCVPMK